MKMKTTFGGGRVAEFCVIFRGLPVIICVMCVLTCGHGATVLWKAPNVRVVQGLDYNLLEFENQLVGSEQVLGHYVVDWRDADYMPGFPPWYEDWEVYTAGGILDGHPSEIWMRVSGQYIYTRTAIPGSIVSIHLVGDNNDGIADIKVDGESVARLNMYAEKQTTVAVLVFGLARTNHQVLVQCESPDVAVLGAATLEERPAKWSQSPRLDDECLFIWGWNEVSRYDTEGFNIAADDWVCASTNPVTKVRWWGSFNGWRQSVSPQNIPSGFAFRFWRDVPAGEKEKFSMPGELLHTVICKSYACEFWGWEWDPRHGELVACFKFEANFEPDQYFYQGAVAGTVYWLSIEAIYPEGAPKENLWGWTTKPRGEGNIAPGAPDAAVTSSDGGISWCPIIWPGDDIRTNQWDLSFELLSEYQNPTVKWVQGPDLTTNGMDVDISGPGIAGRTMEYMAADDFICRVPGWITNVTIWCSWSNDVQSAPLPDLYVGFHENKNGEYPIPGRAIWWRLVPSSEYTMTEYESGLAEWWFTPPEISRFPGDKRCYMISIPIMKDPFYQTGSQAEPQEYWLVIQAFWKEPFRIGLLGWKTSLGHILGGAGVWGIGEATDKPNWQKLLYPPGHPRYGRPMSLAFMLTGIADIHEIKWSQPPMALVATNILSGWDEVSIYGLGQIVADDWVCVYTNPVVALRWWGSFAGWSDVALPQTLPKGFVVTIWSDEPPGQLSFSHPAHCIWIGYCSNYVAKFVGWDFNPSNVVQIPESCFMFEGDLSSGFIQPGVSNIFWVSIAADYGPNGPEANAWGWKTVPRNPSSLAPDAACRIFNPTAPIVGSSYKEGEPIYWPYRTNLWDMAFELFTSSVEIDFGDAPCPYPTLRSQNGARHYVFSDFHLGKRIDAEVDGLPNLAAHGDDLMGTDDEDGVSADSIRLRVGGLATLQVNLVSPTGVGRLDGWIDFNRDGHWTTEEKVADNVPLVSGSNAIVVTVPEEASVGPTYARFRLSSKGGLEPTGVANDGEVEDYCLTLVQRRPLTNIITATITLSTNLVRVSWPAETGVHYRLQGVTNLIGAPTNLLWFDIGSDVIGPTNSQTNLLDGTNRFFRVVIPYIEAE